MSAEREETNKCMSLNTPHSTRTLREAASYFCGRQDPFAGDPNGWPALCEKTYRQFDFGFQHKFLKLDHYLLARVFATYNSKGAWRDRDIGQENP